MSLWQTVYLVTPATTALALLVAPFVVAAFVVVAQRHQGSVSAAGRAALAAYFLLVLVATFSVSYDAGGSGQLEWGSLAYFFAGAKNLGNMEKDMIVREALANFLMFAPFPSLIKFSWPAVKLWVTLCACAAFSFAIEFSQLVAGGGRVADLDDFTLNFLGGGAGVLVFMAAGKLAALFENGRRARHRREHGEEAAAG
ncbi:VanZ family protein [Streptomyces sp. NPDC058683]|uniref:VanZ family protein n=1 Tax=Streptomyces sp. NPDC058683 TaxID=3346597 RepID=UPI003666F507